MDPGIDNIEEVSPALLGDVNRSSWREEHREEFGGAPLVQGQNVALPKQNMVVKVQDQARRRPLACDLSEIGFEAAYTSSWECPSAQILCVRRKEY